MLYRMETITLKSQKHMLIMLNLHIINTPVINTVSPLYSYLKTSIWFIILRYTILQCSQCVHSYFTILCWITLQIMVNAWELCPSECHFSRIILLLFSKLDITCRRVLINPVFMLCLLYRVYCWQSQLTIQVTLFMAQLWLYTCMDNCFGLFISQYRISLPGVL